MTRMLNVSFSKKDFYGALCVVLFLVVLVSALFGSWWFGAHLGWPTLLVITILTGSIATRIVRRAEAEEEGIEQELLGFIAMLDWIGWDILVLCVVLAWISRITHGLLG